MKRPNAIVIGAGKAGTTSLHNYLNEHPEIFGSTEKELMYFSSRFGRGEDWYLSHFPLQDGVKIYFESTPQYSFRDEFPQAAKRIHNFNPEMKIIYIVREPVSRIISHFNHWKRIYSDKYSTIQDAFDDAQERKRFIDRTRYFYQISAYRDFFADDRIHVVFLEELTGTFEDTLNSAFKFLGVSQSASYIAPEIHNKGAVVKETGLRFGEDFTVELRKIVTDSLKDDVQKLLSYCKKSETIWGNDYL